MSGLRYTDATVGYGAAAIVRAVSLAVAPGELVGLIGPNGAGKSTLLRAVTGVADLLAGSLEVDGTPVARLDARHRARLVGVVPQTFAAPFAFSSRAYVEMGRHAHLGRLEAPGETDARIVEQVMELTDTARLANDPADTLSGGDLQRLTLAQALAQQPKVLLLDEPTSHLDLNHRLQVLDLVRDLADSGMAVLGAFHDLDLAARYSDRLAVVADGAVALAGAPAEVLTAETLRSVFAVRAVIGTDAVTGSVSVTPVLRDAVHAPAEGPRVFVVGGSGAAAPIMRRLVLAGFRVSAGALNRGDVDAAVADALGIEFVELPPFGEIDPPAEDRAAHLAAAADVRLVCNVPFGRANLGNLRAVERAGAPTVLVGEMAPERDFAGGEAAATWERITGAGATCVPDADAALAALELFFASG